MKETPSHTTLFTNIRQLIEESKQRVAVAVNTTMSRLYWRIGFQINKDVLQIPGRSMERKLFGTLL
jgi:hypothetical protein